jgi:hypothetical protein
MRSGFANEVWGLTGSAEELMGIFTYLKIGLVVAVLTICGYYVWNYHDMAREIQDQKEKIDALELGQQILAGENAKFKKFMEARTRTGKKVANEQQDITQSEISGNDADLDRRLDAVGVQPYQGDSAAPGGSGGTRNAAPAAPHP